MVKLIKRIFIRSATFVRQQGWLKSLVMQFLERSPKLRYQLRRFIHTGSIAGLITQNKLRSPRTTQVLQDIKQAQHQQQAPKR